MRSLLLLLVFLTSFAFSQYQYLSNNEVKSNLKHSKNNLPAYGSTTKKKINLPAYGSTKKKNENHSPLEDENFDDDDDEDTPVDPKHEATGYHEKFRKYSDPPFTHNHCKETTIRREWRQLTEKERQRYLEANLCLLNSPSERKGGKGSLYDDFVWHHWDIATSIHFTPLFLPFHRAFIIAYENALRTCGDNNEFDDVRTYWDIALDSFAPSRAIVFQEKYFGGNGNKNDDYCLQSGTFGGRIAEHPKKHCLRRNFDLNQIYTKGNAEATIGAMFTDELLEMSKKNGEIRQFDYFRNLLESTIHEALHFGIGGNKGDMSKADTAPNDPIFWLHHGNIDRVWSEFQKAFPKLAHTYNGKNEDKKDVNENDEIDLGPLKKYLPYGWDKKILRVKDVFDIKEWCYDFSKSVRWGEDGEIKDNIGESRIYRGFLVASQGPFH
ncbi:hypothetical protein HK099_000009 [Clydaea vesicula]|uniref:Tyrosinase copper-binding domain-containing protein n=1 Tax=Clydaea vesicula TaxID=447962 RepID=A0AAD5U8M0_9FUNG|nr:hypothetical protein HK099_000009 [Clydaea vesicula]